MIMRERSDFRARESRRAYCNAPSPNGAPAERSAAIGEMQSGVEKGAFDPVVVEALTKLLPADTAG